MKHMSLNQYINYVAVDICESINMDPKDEAISVLEKVIGRHLNRLYEKKVKNVQHKVSGNVA